MSNITITLSKLLLIPTLMFGISCSSNENSSSNERLTWDLSDGNEFPENRPLSRAEDGVILSDGTLIVADQRYGLAMITTSGLVEPFGNFKSLGYQHNPPEVESGPNGVHLTPDRKYVITADVFSGKIYKSSLASDSTELIHSHEYGVNTARQDSTGAIWFTQSTENKNEERLFGALDKTISDGVLYRLPPSGDKESPVVPEVVLKGLNFANGFYIDEDKKKLYLSEMMSNRVLSFDVDTSSGSISNQTTLALIPTPDNMELNNDGHLWVASPLSNQIYSIDTETGESYVVFDAQTEIGLKSMQEGVRRIGKGEGFAELLSPELTGDMPGLLTGMIIGEVDQPFYVANLGASLIKVSKK